ncbi:hypothetical protein M514_07525 [Trichuris suis]|uniref:Uncharacterized protein n=1 Tax=Trichuris suis TaxID=68888 RepID=A0A085NE97_9BILA|nr:hypothetical protein M513_07525 [Trichuris suis]KFD67793.1 hypothetical protein M514_07525 [Trichuris suis]
MDLTTTVCSVLLVAFVRSLIAAGAFYDVSAFQGDEPGHRCRRSAPLMASNVVEVLSLILFNMTSDSLTSTDAHKWNARPTVECYSCMSTLYENLWYETGLSLLYKKPEVFSSYCDQQTFDHRKLMVKPCPDYCVAIENENVIFGIVRRTYMRGCLSDVINYNVTTVGYLTRRHKCMTVPMRYLFMGTLRSVQNQPVRICVCFNGLCNGATSSSAVDRHFLRLFRIGLALLILLISVI